ncbi:M14 family zinc carboxypeptidase [Litorilituus lipolyticus]|nr:M14 family zinc carboxypeptidase [Litorilituus lipolyticus]
MKHYAVLFVALLSVVANQVCSETFTYTEVSSGNGNIPLGYPVPTPVDSLTPIDGFRSYQSLDLRHQQLAAQTPLIERILVGESYNGRSIWAYKFSDENNTKLNGGLEGSALINGGIHAREWQSPEALTGYMEALFEGRENKYIEQYLLENLTLVLIPVLNIDGFLQTQRYFNKVTDLASYPREGRMRRKNMRAVDEDIETLADNLHGIDLNRNNNPYWATNPNGSSSDRSSLIYHGSSVASEPETKALQQAAIVAGEERLRFYTDTHSFSQIYFTPMTGEDRRDNVTAELAKVMRAANSYKYNYGPSSAGSGIGSTDEYFANTYQIPSYTLEIEPLSSASEYGGFGVSHDGFILPNSEVSRMREETSKAALAGLYAMTEPPVVTGITISHQGEIVWQQEWQGTNTGAELVTLLEQVLLADTTYQLRISFNKPMRRVIDNEVVAFSNLSQAQGIKLYWQYLHNSEEKEFEISDEQGGWLLDGFAHYKTDSYQIDFKLPSDFDWQSTTRLNLKIETTDMVGQKLDANPSTVADWQDGHWQGYENALGNSSDSGGVDKSMRLIDDNSALFPVVEQPKEEPKTSSSGGAAGFFIGLICFIVLCRRKGLSYK